jgi:hypothetical protein
LKFAEAVRKVNEMKGMGLTKAKFRPEVDPKRKAGGKRNYMHR